MYLMASNWMRRRNDLAIRLLLTSGSLAIITCFMAMDWGYMEPPAWLVALMDLAEEWYHEGKYPRGQSPIGRPPGL